MRYRLWALIAALTVFAWVFVEMRGQTIRPVCPPISTTGKINTPAVRTSSTGIPTKPESRIPHLIATPDGFTLAGVVEETRTGPGWKSLAKPVIPTFPKSFAEAVRVRSGIADVGCTPVGGNTESKGKLSADGSLVYEEAFKGCDVQYRCGALKTEEFIIVKNEQSKMEWSWDLDLGNGDRELKPRLTSANTIEMVDGNSVPRLRINAPEGKDASGIVLRSGERLKLRIDGARITLSTNIKGLKLPLTIDPSWSSTGGMAFARCLHSAMKLNSGKVLVIGGQDDIGPVAPTEIYDPVSETWSNAGLLNVTRVGHTATLLNSGKVLVVGGNNPNTSSCEVYTPDSGWTQTATMSEPRALHGAILLNDGRVLIVGGYYYDNVAPYNHMLQTCAIYDPSSDTLSSASSTNFYRYNTILLPWNNNTILAIGSGTTAEEYNPSADTWTSETFGSDGTQLAVTLASGINLAVENGSTNLYEPSTLQKVSTGNPIQLRDWAAMALMRDDKVFLCGGEDEVNGDAVWYNSSEVYDSSSGTWAYSAPMISKREQHTATTLNDGNVLIAGGYIGNKLIPNGYNFTTLALCEVFDPHPNAVATNVATHFNTQLPITLTAESLSPTVSFTILQYPTKGTVSSNGNSIFTYSPDANYVGSDSFTFKATDSFGDSNIATATISVTDTAPVGTAQNLNTHFNTALPITISASDADNDPLTYAIVAPPVNGSLSGTAPNLIYTPNNAYVGSDSFTFKANDGALDSNVATISISVTDTAPAATSQSITATSGIATVVTLAGTDADSDPLTFAIVTPPANGTLTGTAPNMTYTANASFSGSDTFMFKTNDGALDSTPAIISITVNAPVPTISGITPNSTSVGGSAFILTVNGTNFVTGSTVQWNGSNRTTIFVSTTQLTATISAGDLATPGQQSVTVVSPAPGGGTSNTAIYFVYSGPVGSWIVTNTNDAGLGSLRFAMQNCQASDTINFDPSVFAVSNASAATVISTFSELPALSTGHVKIDAQNVRVTVNGAGAGSSNGFVINSANNQIMGLSVTAFTRSGIFITGSAATNNVIGGDRTLGSGPNGQGLRISGNGAFGVQIDNGACNNVVKGCWIGLDASGTSAEPNLGGVLIQGGACTNTIGSTVAGQANVISGNTFEGITISGAGTNGNVIIGNIVGASGGSTAGRALGATGRDDLLGGRSALANGSAGVFLSKGTQGSRVGGSNAGEGNAIAFNAANGVEVHDANSAHNTLRANAISQNASGGIALFDGSNNGIGAAVIATVNPSPVAGLVHVTGSTATDGTIDVFNDVGNQGATYLGSTQSSGGSWAIDVNADISRNITATVTDASGNTSPFGVFLLQAPAFASAPAPSDSQVLINGLVTFSAPAGPGSTVIWNFGDGSTASGTTATHNYGTAGTYIVTVTMTDSNGFQTSSTFSETIVSSNSDISTHHDGFSDEEEAALGAPANPTSALFGVNPAKLSMTVTKLAIRLNFAKSGGDNLALTGTIMLPTGFKPTGQHAAIDVGGVIKAFVLDKNGKGSASGGILKITIPKSGTAAKYQASLTRGSFAVALSDEGLTGDKDIKTAAARTVIVRLIAAQSLFEKTQLLQYTAKAHKMGSAK